MANARGRVAVVTGATSGIGRALAEALAAAGAVTVVVGRGEARAVRAAAEISSRTSNPHVYPIGVSDLALRAEVARLAQVLLDRYPRIHLLVNNAGGYFHRRELTSEGLERTFALNVLGPFLLTARLARRLEESGPSRVLMVASEAHRRQDVDLGDLQGDRQYRGYRAYGRSKVELLLLTREFAHRWPATTLTVNAAHPGFVASGFGKNNGVGIALAIGLLGRLFGRSARAAAADLAFLATDPSVATTTGAYFDRRLPRSPSPAASDPVAALRLFEACAELSKPFL